MARFSATIYKLGINPVVDPPERVLKSLFTQAGRTKGPVPVRGKLNGAEFRQTLIRYSGAWRLYVNGVMLKASGTKVGDEVRVEIEFDESPPQVGMPESLATALSNDVAVRKAFDALTPYRQKEILRYIGSLKSEEAIEKNVEKVSRQLKHKGV